MVQLGFSVDIEDDEHRMLVAHNSADYQEWDGGQLGGRPSWLNPRDIPNTFIKCQNCDSPMLFVCQLYAPSEEVNPNAFHRSLYVFACPNSSLCGKQPTGSIRALRTQLPKQNLYFPEKNQPDDIRLQHLPSAWNINLCKLCGQRGLGKCPIQQEYFCGPHHQREYKKQIHDKVQKGSKHDGLPFLPSLLTESELVVEEEPPLDEDETTQKKVENALFKSQGADIENNSDDDNDDDMDLEQKDLNKMVGAADETVSNDSVTMSFYDRINNVANVKAQCLRYLRWPDSETCKETKTPLWIRSDCQPESIPHCERCGAERRFEFQLMPQMLHYLFRDFEHHTNRDKVDIVKKEDIAALQTATSIIEQAPSEHVPPDFAANKEAAINKMRNKLMDDDENVKMPSWGVVSIYTCTESCGGGTMEMEKEDMDLGAYVEEFAWKQPSLD